MKKLITLFLLMAFTASITFLVGRSFRVSKVPHGSIKTCNTCHTNGGGTPRNSFGKDVEQLVSPDGNETFWGPALAAKDSDGDGFTNGEELQDPDGAWIQGESNPGNASLVTDPSDPNSHPPVTSVDLLSNLPNKFELFNNFPNPFNPTTKIHFGISENSNVRIDIFNSIGELVKTLVNENFAPGKYSSVWNGTDNFNSKVNSGVYFYRISANSFVQTKRMVLMK